MTPEQLKRSRLALGLTQAGLAEELRMDSGDRQIRRWESGQAKVSGPASVAIELMMEKYNDQTT